MEAVTWTVVVVDLAWRSTAQLQAQHLAPAQLVGSSAVTYQYDVGHAAAGKCRPCHLCAGLFCWQVVQLQCDATETSGNQCHCPRKARTLKVI